MLSPAPVEGGAKGDGAAAGAGDQGAASPSGNVDVLSASLTLFPADGAMAMLFTLSCIVRTVCCCSGGGTNAKAPRGATRAGPGQAKGVGIGGAVYYGPGLRLFFLKNATGETALRPRLAIKRTHG